MNMMPHNQLRSPAHQARQARRRSGATAVEFAFCAPIFFLFVFAGIELARANMLIHTVESASLQGARRGIVSGATAAQCKSAAQNVLDIARVHESTVTISPSKIKESTEQISVQVTVPLDNNMYFAPKFFGGKTISRTMIINREF